MNPDELQEALDNANETIDILRDELSDMEQQRSDSEDLCARYRDALETVKADMLYTIDRAL